MPGWTRTAGTSEAVTGGHASARACQLCAANGRLGIMTRAVNVTSPGRYTLRAWARAPAPPTNPGGGLGAGLSLSGKGAGIENRALPTNGDFDVYEVTLESTSDGGTMLAGLRTTADPGACIVVDDITITREPL